MWLPSTNKTPIPSPELIATGAVAPKDPPKLTAWRVTGLLLSVNAAIDFLLVLPPHHIGADLIAWRTATLLAMEIIALQQVRPSLARDGKHLKAKWQPRPTPTTSQKITALARSLPPLCRAAVDDPDKASPPRALVEDFLATTIGFFWCASTIGIPLVMHYYSKHHSRSLKQQHALQPSKPSRHSIRPHRPARSSK